MRQLLLTLLLFPTLVFGQYSDTTTCTAGMDELTYAIHYNQQQCEDSCSGAYEIEVLVGSGSYLYSVSGNSGYFSASSEDSLLCVDDYVCVVTDQVTGINCTLLFSVDSLVPFSHSIATTNVTATGACDGTAELTLSGGIPAYYVTWYTANQQPIPNEDSTYIDNLCAGGYYYSVNTSYQSCCDTCTGIPCDTCLPFGGTGGLIPFTINEPLTVTVVWTLDEQCEFACDGMASIMASGGTGTYTYDIGFGPQNTGDFFNLCPSFYNVVVTDDQGNTGSASFDIFPAFPVFVTTSVSHETCANSCDGQIVITDMGGDVLQYSIDGGFNFSQSGTFDSLCPASYDIWVMTIMGCIVPVSVEVINQGSSPTIGAVAVTNETSLGANDGCIVAIPATGGTPPYMYQVNNVPVTSLPHCGLSPGNHDVCVIDANGCESCTTITIGQGCGLQVTESWLGTCVGTCEGEANVFVTGNNGPVSIVWMDSTGIIVDYGEYITNLCSGIYTFDVVDSSGCSYFGTVFIEDWAQPQVSTTIVIGGTTDQACAGEIEANVSGGTQPYTYEWKRCENDEVIGTGDLAEDLCPGTYYLTAKDANQCSASSSCDTIQNIAFVDVITAFEWSVAPNPSADAFTVQSTTKMNFELNIFNMAGQHVVQTLVTDGEFNGNALELAMSPGVYLIEINSDGFTDRKRLVIQ